MDFNGRTLLTPQAIWLARYIWDASSTWPLQKQANKASKGLFLYVSSATDTLVGAGDLFILWEYPVGPLLWPPLAFPQCCYHQCRRNIPSTFRWYYLAPRHSELSYFGNRALGNRNTQLSFDTDVTKTVEIPDQKAAHKTKAIRKPKWKDSVTCGNKFRIREKRKLNQVEGKATPKSLRLMHRHCPVATQEDRQMSIFLICFALLLFCVVHYFFIYFLREQNKTQTVFFWGRPATNSKKDLSVRRVDQTLAWRYTMLLHDAAKSKLELPCTYTGRISPRAAQIPLWWVRGTNSRR